MQTQTLVVRSLYAKDTFENTSYTDILSNLESKYTEEYYESEEWEKEFAGYVGLDDTATKAQIYSRVGLSDTTDITTFVSRSKMYFSPLEKTKRVVNDLKTKFIETEDYSASVNNNGGFYIGRYEVTYTGGNASSKPATTNTRANYSDSITDGMVWNWIDQKEAKTRANAYDDDKTGFTSTLLTGASWDRTLGWLFQTNNKTLVQISSDSTDWGNYSDDIFSNNPGIAKTGEYIQTKANNIYDLAGNVDEWTSETCGDRDYNSPQAVKRGGNYSCSGVYAAASLRNDGEYANWSDGTGFRLALYLD